MLKVMNDPLAEDARRDKMAQAAAPFVHAKPGEKPMGKKGEQEAAAGRVGGKYAPPSAPKLVVSNP
jgi:hypothetical protein